MNFRPRRTPEPEINLISLIDVMLMIDPPVTGTCGTTARVKLVTLVKFSRIRASFTAPSPGSLVMMCIKKEAHPPRMRPHSISRVWS